MLEVDPAVDIIKVTLPKEENQEVFLVAMAVVVAIGGVEAEVVIVMIVANAADLLEEEINVLEDIKSYQASSFEKKKMTSRLGLNPT